MSSIIKGNSHFQGRIALGLEKGFKFVAQKPTSTVKASTTQILPVELIVFLLHFHDKRPLQSLREVPESCHHFMHEKGAAIIFCAVAPLHKEIVDINQVRRIHKRILPQHKETACKAIHSPFLNLTRGCFLLIQIFARRFAIQHKALKLGKVDAIVRSDIRIVSSSLLQKLLVVWYRHMALGPGSCLLTYLSQTCMIVLKKLSVRFVARFRQSLRIIQHSFLHLPQPLIGRRKAQFRIHNILAWSSSRWRSRARIPNSLIRIRGVGQPQTRAHITRHIILP